HLRALLFDLDVDLPRIVIGEEGLIEVATHAEADCVVSATVGAVGFVPTLRALAAGERVALAECLRAENVSEVRRIVLTASGGPFRKKSKTEMQEATVSEALHHPTWN